MSECSTVSSPLLQKEKPTRLYANDISGDSKWFEQQSSSSMARDETSQLSCLSADDKLARLGDGIERLQQRMDKFAAANGYK